MAERTEAMSDVLRRAVGIGPLVGALLGGLLMWLPTHELSTAAGTAVILVLILGVLRAADPYLSGLWRVIAVVPRGIRIAVAAVVAIAFAINQFGLDAAGKEVQRARTALLFATIVAYVLIRPRADARE